MCERNTKLRPKNIAYSWKIPSPDKEYKQFTFGAPQEGYCQGNGLIHLQNAFTPDPLSSDCYPPSSESFMLYDINGNLNQ